MVSAASPKTTPGNRSGPYRSRSSASAGRAHGRSPKSKLSTVALGRASSSSSALSPAQKPVSHAVLTSRMAHASSCMKATLVPP